MPILPEWWDKQLELLEAQRGFHESVLRDMVRQLNKTDFTITDTVAWENEKLQQAGMLEEDILKYIAEAADKEKEEIREQFAAAKSEVFNYDNEELVAAGYEPEEFRHMSPEMIRTMNAAMKKTFTEAVSLTRTTAVTSQSAFIRAADVAHQQVISGAWSYQKAIRYAVKTTVAAQGAKVIYPSGASAKIDVAYRRAVLTGVNQTVAKLQEMRAEECENDLMETTAHYGARVEHAEWQGQLVSLSGAKGYLSKEDVGYGEVTGIFGANCRHNWHMFFEGVSKPAYTPEQLEEFKNAKVSYDGETMPVDKAISKQRTMERSIRQTKEELVCLDECIKNCTQKHEKEKAQLEFDKKCVRLKQREYKLKDFCNQTGLQFDNFRVQVFAAETENGFRSFDRSVSGKAVFASQRHYDDWKKSIGAESLPKTLAKYYDMKYNDKEEYKLLQRYAKSVSSGMISPLSTYSNFKDQIQQVENKLIGMTTSTGLKITGQSNHFVERIIGSAEDPTKKGAAAHKPRSGVSVDVIKKTLENPDTTNIRTDKKGRRSIQYINDLCIVSVNVDTGTLIQVNPFHK